MELLPEETALSYCHVFYFVFVRTRHITLAIDFIHILNIQFCLSVLSKVYNTLYIVQGAQVSDPKFWGHPLQSSNYITEQNRTFTVVRPLMSKCVKTNGI